MFTAFTVCEIDGTSNPSSFYTKLGSPLYHLPPHLTAAFCQIQPLMSAHGSGPSTHASVPGATGEGAPYERNPSVEGFGDASAEVGQSATTKEARVLPQVWVPTLTGVWIIISKTPHAPLFMITRVASSMYHKTPALYVTSGEEEMLLCDVLTKQGFSSHSWDRAWALLRTDWVPLGCLRDVAVQMATVREPNVGVWWMNGEARNFFLQEQKAAEQLSFFKGSNDLSVSVSVLVRAITRKHSMRADLCSVRRDHNFIDRVMRGEMRIDWTSRAYDRSRKLLQQRKALRQRQRLREREECDQRGATVATPGAGAPHAATPDAGAPHAANEVFCDTDEGSVTPSCSSGGTDEHHPPHANTTVGNAQGRDMPVRGSGAEDAVVVMNESFDAAPPNTDNEDVVDAASSSSDPADQQRALPDRVAGRRAPEFRHRYRAPRRGEPPHADATAVVRLMDVRDRATRHVRKCKENLANAEELLDKASDALQQMVGLPPPRKPRSARKRHREARQQANCSSADQSEQTRKRRHHSRGRLTVTQ